MIMCCLVRIVARIVGQWYMSMEPQWSNRETKELGETSSSVTSSTRSLTWGQLVMKTGLHGEKPASSHLSYSTLHEYFWSFFFHVYFSDYFHVDLPKYFRIYHQSGKQILKITVSKWQDTQKIDICYLAAVSLTCWKQLSYELPPRRLCSMELSDQFQIFKHTVHNPFFTNHCSLQTWLRYQ